MRRCTLYNRESVSDHSWKVSEDLYISKITKRIYISSKLKILIGITRNNPSRCHSEAECQSKCTMNPFWMIQHCRNQTQLKSFFVCRISKAIVCHCRIHPTLLKAWHSLASEFKASCRTILGLFSLYLSVKIGSRIVLMSLDNGYL